MTLDQATTSQLDFLRFVALVRPLSGIENTSFFTPGLSCTVAATACVARPEMDVS